MTQDPIQAQARWMSLASIVDMACHRLQISVNHYFQKLLEFGKWELMALKLDRANEVKTVLLPISDVNTCLLPPDCVDWTKVGIQSNQYVKTIGINSELSRIDRTVGVPDFGARVSPGWLPNGLNVNEYSPFNFFNYGGMSLPAMPGGLPHEGHFQVRNCPGGKEILLDGNFGCSELYVEYIALGISCCGQTLCEPYIADYILKKILEIYEEEIEPKATEASISRRKRESAFAYTLVSGRTNSIDKDTLLLTIRRAYRLTPNA